jgi:hypothetical protein
MFFPKNSKKQQKKKRKIPRRKIPSKPKQILEIPGLED